MLNFISSDSFISSNRFSGKAPLSTSKKARRKQILQRAVPEMLEPRQLLSVAPLTESHDVSSTADTGITAFLTGRLGVDTDGGFEASEAGLTEFGVVGLNPPVSGEAPDTVLTDMANRVPPLSISSSGWKAAGESETINVPQFDTMGGTRVLTKVDVSYAADMVMDFDGSVENSGFTQMSALFR